MMGVVAPPNKVITRLILAFVVSSLTVTLVPLLESGGSAPLVPIVDRSLSLPLYAGFLLVFLVFVLPSFMLADSAGGRGIHWMALAAYLLVFATIPLIFTAYISGVSARALLTVAGLCGAAAGLPLMLARLLRREPAALSCWSIGTLLLFVLPALALYFESWGRLLPPFLLALSPLGWIDRICRLHQAPDPVPFLLAGGLLWLLAGVPGRRSSGWRACLVLALFGVGASPAAFPTVQEEWARVESLAGGVARAGLRTPLRIALSPGEGWAVVSVGGDALALPRDGQPRSQVMVPGPETRRVRVEADGWLLEVPLPVEMVPESLLLVGQVQRGDGVAPLDLPESERLRSVPLPAQSLPRQPGALEAFDLLVVEGGFWREDPQGIRPVLEGFAVRGGTLVVVEPADSSPVENLRGSGRVLSGPAEVLKERVPFLPRPRRATAIDPELLRTFAPPDWQEMDLSALILFAVVYHGAFLLAFLLPLLLDSRKALGVYLVSVGFVVLVVALGAYHVLGRIFLRDNQVYTQSITLAVASPGESGTLLEWRQFLCFASMSGERRDLAFAGAQDLTVYRPAEETRVALRQIEADGVTLSGVDLDRFRGKLMVRVDGEVPAPVTVVPEERVPGAFRLELHPTALDPLGVATAGRVGAFSVESGKWARRYRIEGPLLVDDGPAEDAPLPMAAQVLYRRLMGHFAPPLDRYLVVRFQGLRRPDGASRYLVERDLGGYVVFPLPE